ncbi:hypothetical protein L3Q82_004356 [Scortum barcoo]|uniref:Uncharacterized protein n=1 Tax=Scortum barcoo TaxID=214431 RepID=A0ACB8VJZ6_9TELE|nr:hypothetical protein L3Q82_004356 [Scortum barcoo]
MKVKRAGEPEQARKAVVQLNKLKMRVENAMRSSNKVMQPAKESPIIQYDREKLLQIRSVVEKTFSSPPPPAYNGESPWRSLPVVEPEQRRRRRKRGSRAGVLVRLRKRENRPPLPSILLANVQSLDNKLDELRSRMAFQRDIKNCNVLVFTETWLDPSIPDSAIVSEGLSIHRQDRTINSGKSKGGGVCFMVNNKWCSDVEVISTGCSPDLEHLMIRCRPYYLGQHHILHPDSEHRRPPGLCAQPSACTPCSRMTDCVATHSSNTIIKFADDTTVIGLITGDDETAYREEVRALTSWCQDNEPPAQRPAKLRS